MAFFCNRKGMTFLEMIMYECGNKMKKEKEKPTKKGLKKKVAEILSIRNFEIVAGMYVRFNIL